MIKIYIVGDIFKVDDKEYRLRVINKHKICWLEPVVYRNNLDCVTGGLNRIYHFDELCQLEYMNECY